MTAEHQNFLNPWPIEKGLFYPPPTRLKNPAFSWSALAPPFFEFIAQRRAPKARDFVFSLTSIAGGILVRWGPHESIYLSRWSFTLEALSMAHKSDGRGCEGKPELRLKAVELGLRRNALTMEIFIMGGHMLRSTNPIPPPSSVPCVYFDPACLPVHL